MAAPLLLITPDPPACQLQFDTWSEKRMIVEGSMT
jgi:hypothetical protein